MNQPSRKSGRSPMQLNLTSMIDVVFLLLVYFVMTAAFTEAEGVITANMPHGPSVPQRPLPVPDIPIKVTVSPLGEAGYRLTIDQSPVAPMSFADLTRLLEGLREGKGGFFPADNLVIIQTDGRTRWQHALNAFNAALNAGYTNIRFAAP
jgi:biopolymer transport protein ExbD